MAASFLGLLPVLAAGHILLLQWCLVVLIGESTDDDDDDDDADVHPTMHK